MGDYDCTTNGSSEFVTSQSSDMEQQPLQASIDQHGAGDASNAQQNQSVIGLARPEDDNRKIFVGGLSWDTTAKDLKDYFGQFGPVEEALIKQDISTNRSRGFGFVLFENEESVISATSDPNTKHTLLGKHIDPKAAKSKDKKDPITKIFVGGLDPELTKDEINEFFEQYGKVEQIDLPHDKNTNKRRAFAFVSFDSEDAVGAVCVNSKLSIHGKEVDVKKATPHHQQGGNPRGRGQGMRGRGYSGRGRAYSSNSWNDYSGGNYAGFDYNQASNYGYYDYSPTNYYNNPATAADYTQNSAFTTSPYSAQQATNWGGAAAAAVAAASFGNYSGSYDQSASSYNGTTGNSTANQQQQRQWATHS